MEKRKERGLAENDEQLSLSGSLEVRIALIVVKGMSRRISHRDRVPPSRVTSRNLAST